MSEFRAVDERALSRWLMDRYHGAISDSSVYVYEILQLLAAAPTIDPVRHARWDINKSPSGIVTHRCTNCRCEPPRRSWRAKPYAFCPDCGARMDAEEET
jgi:hypothetical protein